MKDISKYLIKRTLFLIITIFIIGTLHQCAKAYTWDDLYEFCYNNQGNSDRANQNNTMSYFVTIANDMKTSLTSAGYNLDDYNTFVIKIGYSQSRYNVYLCMVKNAESFSRWNSNSRFQYNNTQAYDLLYMQSLVSEIATYPWNSANNLTGTGTYKDNAMSVYDSVGLFENASTTFLSGTGLFAQNYYNAITSNDITITNNSTIPFNIQQGLVGLAYDINNITYKLYTQSETYIADLTAVYTSVNSGKSFNLLLDTFNLINTGYYKINMYNSEEVIYTSDTFKITKSRTPQAGDITNSSGDVTGQVDLTETNNKLDNIANAIISGDKETQEAIKEQTRAIESGNNILQKIYNDMFTLQSGDLEEIIQGAIDTSQMPSGELQTVMLRARCNTRTKRRFYNIMGCN